MLDHRRLVDVLAQFARHLTSDYGPHDVLVQLGERAVELLPVDSAGIMLRGRDGNLEFATSTDELTGRVERFQVEYAQGPCISAARSGHPVFAEDLGDESSSEFPRFRVAAALEGMGAIFAFPMVVHDSTAIGALDLYRREPGPLGEDEAWAAATLADVAAAYLVNSQRRRDSERLADQLQRALDSRLLIEHAKGKAAAELGCGPEEAFERLRRRAREERRETHLVAEDLVEGRLAAEDL